MGKVILKDCRIIDPYQHIDIIGSISIKDGKIESIGEVNIKGDEKVLDLKNKIVSPGFIDIHCHPGLNFSWLSACEKQTGHETGVLLLCDAGSAGEANFDLYREYVVKNSETDILCFINIASTGLIRVPEIISEKNIDAQKTLDKIKSNLDLIKGVKVRAIQAAADSVGLKAIEIAKRVASDCNLPLMVHIGETRQRHENDIMDDFTCSLSSLMEKGDIISHYLTWEPGGMIRKDGYICREMRDMYERGVFFDSCHGLNHFSFEIARIALLEGYLPHLISTDMASMTLAPVQSLAVSMSKFLSLGLTINQVVEMVTKNPAQALNALDKRGTLCKGEDANITIFELIEGEYTFCDGNGGARITGNTLIEPRMIFKNGDMHPAYSNYHEPPTY